MSTLVQISEQVARELGRPELVSDFNGGTYTPTATFLRIIKSAHILLDDRGERRDETIVYTQSLAAGEYEVDLLFDLHTIDSVDLETSTTRSVPLIQRTYEAMRELYPEPFSGVTTGEPSSWCRVPPAHDAASATARTILVMPPADVAYTVSVIGSKYVTLPSSNSDESWWSYYKPQLLIKAIKRCIAFELNRNATEVEEYDRDIAMDLFEMVRQTGKEEQGGGPDSIKMGYGLS